MIKGNILEDGVLIQSDEPCRIEVTEGPRGGFIAHIYSGIEIDLEQDPIACVDCVGMALSANVGWEYQGEPVQQRHVFRNPHTDEHVVATMEDVLNAGIPIDAETGDDLEYLGIEGSKDCPST